MKSQPVIIIGYNTCHYVWLFRANLIKELQKNGFKVAVVAPEDRYTQRLEGMGVECINFPMKMDKNPIADYLMYRRYLSVFKQYKPAAYLGYTIKPNIYGSMAAARLNIPVINNIAGLGALFVNDGIVTRLVKGLYKIALRKSFKVFFQNPDDAHMFKSQRILNHDRTDVLPGSGIDLDKHSFSEKPEGLHFRFLLIGRMLWDKGVGEFVEAARQIRADGLSVEFCLLGSIDVANPSAISPNEMNEWVRDGSVSYLGFTDDVPAEIAKADCVVLPSYREGTPRTLLEAAAIGRPLITTDAVGCREVVEDGSNGFLCRVRDSDDLANKLREMLNTSHEERLQMARAGRAKMELQFDERIVLDHYIETISQICSPH